MCCSVLSRILVISNYICVLVGEREFRVGFGVVKENGLGFEKILIIEW